MQSKLQFTNEDGTYTVEVDSDSVTSYSDFINNMVRPLSHAGGWTEATINEYLGDYQEVYETANINLAELYARLDDGGVSSSDDFDGGDDESSAEYYEALNKPVRGQVLHKPKKKAKKKS